MSFIRSLYRRQSEALYDYLVWKTSLMITTCESGMARRSSGKCESGVPLLVAVVPFFSETRILVWHSRSGRDFAPCTTRVVI